MLLPYHWSSFLQAVLIFVNVLAHVDLAFPDDIVVQFPSLNHTTVYQPMDQVVISAFKRIYKTTILNEFGNIIPVGVQFVLFSASLLIIFACVLELGSDTSFVRQK